MMNVQGPAWCRKNLQPILQKLRREAKHRGWWKYVVLLPGTRRYLRRLILDSIIDAETELLRTTT
jgi:hypothetical protein